MSYLREFFHLHFMSKVSHNSAKERQPTISLQVKTAVNRVITNVEV